MDLFVRYSKANQPDPLILYTGNQKITVSHHHHSSSSFLFSIDRDCCKSDGDSKYRRLFPQWKDLLVRIDS
jgi:hypothetical protein